MYAIVRAGGRQEKVAVGDLVVVDRVAGEPGASLQLQPLLLVDGENVTSDVAALSGVTVTAEVVNHSRGKKIDILRYKNKSGYRRRQGHRSELTTVKVTGIDTAGGSAAATTTETATTATTADIETATAATTADIETETATAATTTETATAATADIETATTTATAAE